MATSTGIGAEYLPYSVRVPALLGPCTTRTWSAYHPYAIHVAPVCDPRTVRTRSRLNLTFWAGQLQRGSNPRWGRYYRTPDERQRPRRCECNPSLRKQVSGPDAQGPGQLGDVLQADVALPAPPPPKTPSAPPIPPTKIRTAIPPSTEQPPDHYPMNNISGAVVFTRQALQYSTAVQTRAGTPPARA